MMKCGILIVIFCVFQEAHSSDPIVTISSQDPAFDLLNILQSISPTTFIESQCQHEVPANNLNNTWWWGPLPLFITAGSLFQQLTLRQVFQRMESIPRNDLHFSPIPAPCLGTIQQIYLDEKVFIQSCTPDPGSTTSYTCVPTRDAANNDVDTSFLAKEHDTVVMTDNKNYALIVRCVNDKFRDYEVLSTTPLLPESVLEKIRDKVAELGFDPKNFRATPVY